MSKYYPESWWKVIGQWLVEGILRLKWSKSLVESYGIQFNIDPWDMITSIAYRISLQFKEDTMAYAVLHTCESPACLSKVLHFFNILTNCNLGLKITFQVSCKLW